MDTAEIRAVIKAKNGDEESFEMLLKKYEKYLYASAKNYYLADGDREDLIQEAMIGFLKGIKSFDFMCIRRHVFTAIKNSNSKKNLMLNTNYPSDDEKNTENIIYVEKSPNAEEIYLYKELMEEFEKYSEKNFSRMEKEVLNYLLKGYSYGEIVDMMGKSTKTVDNTYQRIKVKVKNWLKEQNGENIKN